MTAIRELFDLPDRVRRGDFVLRLTEGVNKPDETLDQYVVTPQLVKCFDQALGLIQSGVASGSSKGCYLHGSFGCGKSHFMAVLHLLLQENTRARSINELAEVVAKHNDWTADKKFLLVPYHMIGQPDMETAILGGYVDLIERLHPDEPIPAVYRSDEIVNDAVRLRDSMGDTAFFAQLNEGMTGGDDDWGELGSSWDAASFEAAVAAGPRSDARVDLVSVLVQQFFSSAKKSAEYVDLDHGLSIISKHAADMGYDALVLFLDELILWLASRSADIEFVSCEGQKLAKLVEAQEADRPVPLISFVARQRDLRDLVGDKMRGADFTTLSDVVTWWEGRFMTITLEDRNLPAIAEKRVLRPKSAAAKAEIQQAFDETVKIREDVMSVLLTSEANRELFRKIYPFSPAFMEMLIEMSFLLQRDRTALKVMLQLLIDQQDRLKLKDIIPVGDLFDYIAEGDEAVSDDIRRNFEQAKRLYEEKLRPLLEQEYGLSVDDLRELPSDDGKAEGLRNDDRLIKTMLLAALAPNLESFRGLTAERLAALNHGTIRSPIQGREATIVLNKCRKWAGQIGQIKIGDAQNPTIGIQLTGVDTEGIIEDARRFDNRSNRIRRIKELLFEQIGLANTGDLYINHDFTWRGTKRSCEVIYCNVRELPLESLKASGDDWKLVVDWPFDEGDHGPADDMTKLETFRSETAEGSHAIVVLPSFLSQQAQTDLGRLVILDSLLTGDNFSSHVSNLSPTDQQTARSLLQNQRDQLQQRIITYLETAYGINNAADEALDAVHSLEPHDHFQSLTAGLKLRPPAAANLADAFVQLLHQALEFQYPAHPQFDSEVRLSKTVLKRVRDELIAAAQSPDNRHLVEKPNRRDVRQIAGPLKLGEMGETHFVIGQYWRQHFMKKSQEHGGQLTVERLRAWMDEPQPTGLPKVLTNLVILTYAAQTNHSFYLHGTPIEPDITDLNSQAELRTVALPGAEVWQNTTNRAGHLFGLTALNLLNANNVAQLASQVRELAAEYREPCQRLVKALTTYGSQVLDDPASYSRLQAAEDACSLLGACRSDDDRQLIRAIAAFSSEEPDAAIGTSIKRAAAVSAAIESTNWKLLAMLDRAAETRPGDAASVREDLVKAWTNNEHVIGLNQALDSFVQKALEIVDRMLETTSKESPAPAPTPEAATETKQQPSPPSGRTTVRQEDFDDTIDNLEEAIRELKKTAAENPDARIHLTWTIYSE